MGAPSPKSEAAFAAKPPESVGRLAGSNFGGVLSIFDRMFGTYIEPDHRPETGIGYSTASNTNHDRPASISSGVSLSA